MQLLGDLVIVFEIQILK